MRGGPMLTATDWGCAEQQGTDVWGFGGICGQTSFTTPCSTLGTVGHVLVGYVLFWGSAVGEELLRGAMCKSMGLMQARKGACRVFHHERLIQSRGSALRTNH